MRFQLTSAIVLACSLTSVAASPLPQKLPNLSPLELYKKIQGLSQLQQIRELNQVYNELSGSVVCINFASEFFSIPKLSHSTHRIRFTFIIANSPSFVYRHLLLVNRQQARVQIWYVLRIYQALPATKWRRLRSDIAVCACKSNSLFLSIQKKNQKTKIIPLEFTVVLTIHAICNLETPLILNTLCPVFQWLDQSRRHVLLQNQY